MNLEFTLIIDDSAKVFGEESCIELKILIKGKEGLWIASEGNMVGSGVTPAEAVLALLDKRFSESVLWDEHWNKQEGF